MTSTTPKSIKVRRTTYGELPETHRKAIDLAMVEHGTATDDVPVVVETYRLSAFVTKVFCQRFKWTASLDECSNKNDRRRIQKIMSLLETEGQWPYVSYFASDIDELMTVIEEDDDEISVPNHGDGWHRAIAALEAGLSTIDVVFL